MQTGVTASTVVKISRAAKLEKYLEFVLKIFSYFAGVLFFLLMLVTVAHVIGRYAFNKPMIAIIDISGFVMVVGVFMTIAYVMLKNRNICVDIIVKNFSIRVQAIFDFITYLVILTVCILAVSKTVDLGIYLIQSRLSASELNIPIYPFYFIVSVGWGLLGVATLIRLMHISIGMVKK